MKTNILYQSILLVLIIFCCQTRLLDAKNNGKAKDIIKCTTKGCKKTVNTMLKNIDCNVDPCDDFYHYACGNFLKTAKVDPTKPRVSNFENTENNRNEELKAMLEEPAIKGPRVFKMVKQFYRQCLDEAALDKQGLGDALKIFKKAGGWPVLEGKTWRAKSFQWDEAMITIQNLGLTGHNLFTVDGGLDLKNPSQYIIELAPYSSVISRKHLLGTRNEAYYNLMVDIVVMFGAKRKSAEREMKDVLNLEIRLIEAKTDLDKIDPYKDYNLLIIKDLQQRCPYLQWKDFFTKLFNCQMYNDDPMMVQDLRYFDELGKILRTTDKRIIANWMFWDAAKNNLQYLTTEMGRRMDKDSSVTPPRWQKCISVLLSEDLSLKTAVSAMYVRKYVNKSTKRNVMDLTTAIRREMEKLLSKWSWCGISKRTRNAAIKKVKAIEALVAYPDEFFDDRALTKAYAKVDIIGKRFLKSITDLRKFTFSNTYGRFGHAVNRSSWENGFDVTAANAFYAPVFNSILIPFSILRSPFYSSELPWYMNFGGIGTLIGHEITHGFDNMGRQFDAIGKRKDWWGHSGKLAFEKRMQCVIDDANNYTLKGFENGGGLKLNGLQTVGENIADMGGVKLASMAYDSWVRNHSKEIGINEFTPRQMVWLSFANVWCTKYNEMYLPFYISDDNHALSEFRVNNVVRNNHQFAEDFACLQGTPMNPVKKCTVW